MIKWWYCCREMSSVSVSVDKMLAGLSVTYRLRVVVFVYREYMRLDTF